MADVSGMLKWIQDSSGDSKRLYKKLFRFYTGLLVAVILIMTVYFLSLVRNQVLAAQEADAKSLLQEVAYILERDAGSVSYIQADLYKSPQEMWDLIHYLTDNQEEYLRYRLDHFPASSGGSYKGCESFFKDAMEMNEYLVRIEVIGYEKKELTAYSASRTNAGTPVSQDYIQRILEGRESLAREGEFSFLKEFKNPATYETLGCIIYTFQTGQIDTARELYADSHLLLYYQNGETVYDTDGISASRRLLVQRSADPGRELEAYVYKQEEGAYTVLSYIPKKTAGNISIQITLLIALIAFGILVLGTLLIRNNLRGLTRRVDRIVAGMQEVTTGNLQVKLPSSHMGDELDLISENFNEMCRQLELYIRKSYLAEIEQKNAEMAALQSQINPHFLYNTLEAIRMKAICNGDREVGKMLYSMAVMFRSQIKEADIITIAQELHYTKKYLELFEFRYQGKFTARVECPDELMELPVIKFILQPVIENYFVHGIRMEEADNSLHISVCRQGEDVWILVDDNGKGMSVEEMAQKTRELERNQMEKGTQKNRSIGLANVNLRLKAAYGDAYGVFLEKSPEGGVRAILKCRPGSLQEGNADEESNVGGR